MSKRRDHHRRKIFATIYVFMIIGLALILIGGLYIAFSPNVVDVIKKEYLVSIPRKYYGEIVLSPEGGQRLVSENILEIYNITIEGGILKTIANFNTNKTYFFVTARVEGTSSVSPINMVLYLSGVNGTKVGGAQYINNSNAIESENILVFSQLPQGNYKLEVLSNTNIFVKRIVVRGMYYKDIPYTIMSLELRPEEFQHHMLYYIDRIDFRGLQIAMVTMLLGFAMIIIPLMIYMITSIQKQ